MRRCPATERRNLAVVGIRSARHSRSREMPLTHQLREGVLAEGFDGVVSPSFMSPGGTCVALWRWNGLGFPSLKVIDPEGRLPRSAASWL